MDRRIQRTRKMLQDAFFELVDEKGYKAVTIQDITERANVARTTFYLHYDNKEDLFLKWAAEFAKGKGFQLTSREEWLSSTPAPGTVLFFEQLKRFDPFQDVIITSGPDIDLLNRGIDQVLIAKVEAQLRQCFTDAEFSIPIPFMAEAIAGLQTSLISAWVRKSNPFTPQAYAEMSQRLIQSLISEAIR